MIVKYHNVHNSLACGDTFVDLNTGITTSEIEHNSDWEYGPVTYRNELESHITRTLTVDQQAEIYNVLQPLIELNQKYPYRESFRFFSYKHQLFLTGRVAKAVKIAGNSDYTGIDCLRRVFVLPNYGIVVSFYNSAQWDRSNTFSLKVSSSIDWLDSDYWSE